MGVLVPDFSNLSYFIPKAFNLNYEDEAQRHLYYQVLAMKILIFTYMTKTMFPASCYTIVFCIPYCFRRSVSIVSRLIGTLLYTALVTCSSGIPMHLLYILVLWSALEEPDLELLIDLNLFSSAMYFVYHKYLVYHLYADIFLGIFAFAFITITLPKIVSVWILWSVAVSITLGFCIKFKETPLARVHLFCAYIILMFMLLL